MHAKRVVIQAATALIAVVWLVGLMAGQRPAAAEVAGALSTQAFMPLVQRHPPLPTYALQPDTPTYLSNFLNNLGCNWLGLAGRVFDTDSQPVLGLVVQVRAGGVDLPAVQTGSAPAIGPGGYVVYLADHPSATSDYYTIQLFSEAGPAVSEAYAIPTFADCTRNVVLVNFVPAE